MSNSEKAQIVMGLSGRHNLEMLLRKVGLARSSYYYTRSHPPKPTRPELWEAAREIFSRTSNGCGHRQVMMCLRAELGIQISKKTVLKMMREACLRCTIRRKRIAAYSSYAGVVGKLARNIINREFTAERPWQKLGTDVTEFSQPWGKAYLAPVYDFCSKEIVAWSISHRPDMLQQKEMLSQMLSKMPEGVTPILHSDMGWQYQQQYWVDTLRSSGIVQSMSRKGNCLDNAATEQVFGHLKDEFYRGRRWKDFASFKSDLDAYIVFWNTRRRQVKLKGLTPEEFRSQSLKT